MKGKIVKGRYYVHDGGISPWREVTARQWRKLFPIPKQRAKATVFGTETTWNQAVLSDGASVHPSDVKRAMEHADKLGVPTEFLADGRPVFTSRQHQKNYLRAIGMHNRDENWSGRERKIEVDPRDYNYSDRTLEEERHG